MSPAIDFAVDVLRRGWVVAVATESFFGLLADVTQPTALARLFALKPRGSDKGVPLLLPSQDAWAGCVVAIPQSGYRLASAFWPGPLSIALSAHSHLDPRLALNGHVAVRVPGPSPAAELVRSFGRVVTATSANLPGQPPATTAEAVRQSFPDALGDGLAVLEGDAPGGCPSTVVVLHQSELQVARRGAVDPEAVLSVWSNSMA